MVNGYNYWTFISEELPEIARSFFHLSDRRKITSLQDYPWVDMERLN